MSDNNSNVRRVLTEIDERIKLKISPELWNPNNLNRSISNISTSTFKLKYLKYHPVV